MKLFVAGGAGFIGSNFVRLVLNTLPAAEVVNYDLLTYAGNLANLSDFERDKRHRFVRGDIADAARVDLCLEDDCDAVVNFAAESHVDRSILDASEFVRTNIVGTQVLLETARRKGIGRFLQVSTDEVYGSLGETDRFTETTPLAPNSPYSASKASADLLVRAAHKTHGMNTIISRCSNNYGPFQFPEKLIPLMILNALEDRPLPIYGDGLYVRDWIHVEDHCRALMKVLTEGRPGQTYNIGASEEHTNLQVVFQILRVLGKSKELIRYVSDRPGHDRRYAIDCTRIVTELGWKPQIDFEKGLEGTIGWYRENSAWVEEVKSGAYREYYRMMYEDRDRTLSKL